MKKTLLLFTIISLTSCAPKINYFSGVFSAPELHENTIRELGDAVYYSEDVVYRDAVKITQLPSATIFKGDYPFQVGDIIPYSGNNNKQNIYSFKHDYVANNGQLYHSANSIRYGVFGVAIDKQTKKAYPSYGASNSPSTELIDGLLVETSKYVDPNCKKCLKKEFIYNGKANNTLKFVYREYIQDMARPAFTQELQYDLNESNIIGFKGLRIEVMKSTNTTIEYKVLGDIN